MTVVALMSLRRRSDNGEVKRQRKNRAQGPVARGRGSGKKGKGKREKWELRIEN